MVYRIGELVQVSAEDSQEPLERMPADTALAALDAADEGCVGAEAVADLFMDDPRVRQAGRHWASAIAAKNGREATGDPDS